MGDANGGVRPNAPTITGLSPNEGLPGTQVTIRGENLGIDQNDVLMLFICGTDCLPSMRWKSASKIIARVGQASRGPGEVRIMTKSGGRGVSNVKFRVFIQQIGPLEESAVWVDESRTVPGREAIRNDVQITDEKNPLGLEAARSKVEHSTLAALFPNSSGNLRMKQFSPQWFLLEHLADAPISDLRQAVKRMEKAQEDDEKESRKSHKANLYSLINCVDALANLHSELDRSHQNGDFAVINGISKTISESCNKAENVFADVLARKDQADSTRTALGVIMRFKFIFFLSNSIDENMKKADYLSILNDYTRAKSLYSNSDVPLFKELMDVVDEKMVVFKEEMKRKLIDTPVSYEEQSKLIKYLRILDPDSDPSWECITSYYVWLEKVLWDMQTEFSIKAKVNEEERKENGRKHSYDSVKFGLAETDERQEFVTSLTGLMLSKLPAFWKLANTYHSNDEQWAHKLEDINSMLTNVINVSSWLMLNALVPKALPDSVIKQYGSEFATWPEVESPIARKNLVHTLKTTRSLISSLLESQLTTVHVQPLVELCMTVRLKLVSDVIEKGVEGVTALANKADWRQDVIDAQKLKTSLPDFYETQLCECVSSVRDALSSTGYPGEACLFSRERFRETLINLFVHLIFSIKLCYDRIFNQRRERPRHLSIQGAAAVNGGKFSEITTKKLLMVIGDIEFIMARTLDNVDKKMAECGVRYVEQIHERSRAKLSTFRAKLVADCTQMMASTYVDLIQSAAYEYPPDEDVSDFAKEMIMCCVLQLSELELYAPQLTAECLQEAVSYALNMLLEKVSQVHSTAMDVITQVVVDLTALEEALSGFTNLDTRTRMNKFRASLVGKFDQQKLQRCLTALRSGMSLALESLEHSAPIDELNSSNI